MATWFEQRASLSGNISFGAWIIGSHFALRFPCCSWLAHCFCERLDVGTGIKWIRGELEYSTRNLVIVDSRIFRDST